MSDAARPQHRPFLAAAILLAAICLIATMDVVGKILSASVPVMQVNWARFFFHFLFIAPFVFLTGKSVRQIAGEQRAHLSLHIIRGLFLATSSFCFFFAISENPVPDAIAIFFIEPLIVMLLARLFIGEALDKRLILAALAGMAGVLIILRPGAEGVVYTWKILFALGAAVFFAGYIVSARHVAGHTPAVVTSLTTAFFGLLPIMLLMPFIWQTPDTRDWLLMLTVGVLSGAGHTLLILAVRYATASRIAVLHYAEVPIAALISWVIFGYLPDAFLWLGVAVIACANLYALRVAR